MNLRAFRASMSGPTRAAAASKRRVSSAQSIYEKCHHEAKLSAITRARLARIDSPGEEMDCDSPLKSRHRH